jgi:hypothetical protein
MNELLLVTIIRDEVSQTHTPEYRRTIRLTIRLGAVIKCAITKWQLPSACDPAEHLVGCSLRVRLNKRLSLFLNGVDLTHRRVGDQFDCPDNVARMLILEGWAEPADAVMEEGKVVREDPRTAGARVGLTTDD